MPGFLIEYNRRTGDWHAEEFPGPDGHRAALEERLRREQDRTNPDIEIASLNGDSLDTVKKTHSRYFEGAELHAV
ncbi:hypothetical protein ACFQ9V_07590 [Leifsonia sp. NPDC056665]|uniref:hypothetical protein n=1 Tax=Leifsonia sp. NPDC056665 TaxID=3345901 RepID=UPI0036AC7A3A